MDHVAKHIQMLVLGKFLDVQEPGMWQEMSFQLREMC